MAEKKLEDTRISKVKVEDIQELQYTFEILGQLEVVEDENEI